MSVARVKLQDNVTVAFRYDGTAESIDAVNALGFSGNPGFTYVDPMSFTIHYGGWSPSTVTLGTDAVTVLDLGPGGSLAAYALPVVYATEADYAAAPYQAYSTP